MRKPWDLSCVARRCDAGHWTIRVRLTQRCSPAQVNLVQGEKGFLLALPVNVNGRFDGWLCAVFRSKDIFAKLAKPIDNFHFSVEVLSAGLPVYQYPEAVNIGHSPA